MNRFARLAGSMLVVLSVAALALPSSALEAFDVRARSVTGNYLAGQRAFDDLSTAEAARFFYQAAEGDWDNPVLIERAFVALAADGQVGRAADVAKHLLELDSGNELARLVVGTEALKQRRYASAAKTLDSLTPDNFAGISGLILRSWAYVGDKRADEALTKLDAMGREGLSDFLVFHRALMAEASGRSDLALELAEQAYIAEPFVARIVEGYARMLGNAGRFDDANAVIADFEAEGLTHPLIDQVKASLAANQRPGMFATSVQVGAAEMFHGIGVALARDGSPDLAVVFLRLALYLDPSADVVALVLGQLLDNAGQHAAANAIYDGVPATSPMKPTATIRVAANLDSTGERTEAIRRLGNIVATRPNDIEAISTLGDLLRADEQYASAAEVYSKALALTGGKRPADWRFYYVRGIAYERDKQWPKAEADFQAALKLSPDQPQVLNYLGYSWVDQGMHLDEALTMIEKAVAAVPNDGYIVDSLGWAFYRLGRFDEAVEVLERAVQLRPNDAEINDHLGDAYWRADRRLEARFQWNIASSVDKEGNVKERAAPKLKAGLDAVKPTE